MKRLRNLRKVSGGVWTDGVEKFYFATLDEDDNMSIAALTVSGLTASRLLSTDSDKKLASVANLASWIAGTASEVTVTNDGDGTITISLPDDIKNTRSTDIVCHNDEAVCHNDEVVTL